MSKQIIIEAGHHFRPGKPDPGAVSDGYSEAELTRHAKERIIHYLDLFYPELTVLGDNDKDTLGQVISWIKSIEGNNSIGYSIHWNAASNDSATGVEAFISDNASAKTKRMAPRAVDVVSKISGLRNRGVKTESQSARGKLGILNTRSPFVLLEFAFINNPSDREVFFEWQEHIYITLAHEMAYQAKND